MPFSHHSHSGQFCQHASNTLEEMVQVAISKGFAVLCLTEHMPREEKFVYEDEIVFGKTQLGHANRQETSRFLFEQYSEFFDTATKLKQKYKDEILLFVGMEIEWVDADSHESIRKLFSTYHLDLFVGSVHFVRSIPIDYSNELYQQALQICGGAWLTLYEDYFDTQYAMLQALRPPIVGHFDLVRLKSDQPGTLLRKYDQLWAKITRNIRLVVEYDGLFELNTAALRKGLDEPYPSLEICKEIVALKGKFTFSDDAHAVDQVGTNYKLLLPFLEKLSIETVYCWSASHESNGPRSGVDNAARPIPVAELKRHPLFTSA